MAETECGAGYAGLPAAKRLARHDHPDEVTATTDTAFPPILKRAPFHQLATARHVATMSDRNEAICDAVSAC